MADQRPSIESALNAFGVDATVTPPGGAAVPARVFWLPSVTVHRPAGRESQRAEQQRTLVVPIAGLPAMPRGTVIAAPEVRGGAVLNWKTDSAEKMDFDHYRTVVVPYEEG